MVTRNSYGFGAKAIFNVGFVVTVIFHNCKKILFSQRNVVLKILKYIS